MHVSYNSKDSQLYRRQGSIKKQQQQYCINRSIGIHSSAARTNYRTRVMLLPALMAGGRRVQRYSQLVCSTRPARVVFVVCGVWVMYMTVSLYYEDPYHLIPGTLFRCAHMHVLQSSTAEEREEW